MLKSTLIWFFLTTAFTASAESSFLPPIDGKGVDPKFLEATKKDYCIDIDNENALIEQLNALAKANAVRLKKGSFAVYEHNVTQKDPKTGKITREEKWTERWEVTSIRGDLAQVTVTSEQIGSRTEEYKNMPLFFAHKMDVKKPLTCMYWKIFADKRKLGKVTIKGKELPTIERTQAVLGNILPTFTYAKGVPFNKTAYTETITYESSVVVKTHVLTDYSF